jgi:hypothetical protein
MLCAFDEYLIVAFVVGADLHRTIWLLALPNKDSLLSFAFILLVESIKVWKMVESD